MKAYVLCGGEGTRLRPYTYKMPKPMLPLGGRPILHYVLSHLKKNGITEIVLSVGYLKDKIIRHFGDGSGMGLDINYLVEESPQNTAGALLPEKGKAEGSFLVTMGDHLTDIDLKKMEKSHAASGAIATMALASYSFKVPYGVVDTGKGGAVTGFREKPEHKYMVNTGIYILEPEVFNFIRPKDDFAKDVFPRMLKEGKSLNAFPSEAKWLDIGSLNEYEKMKEKFTKGEAPL